VKRLLTTLLLVLIATVAHAELPSASAAVVNQALASGKPTVIDLGARTCISCKKMAPILEDLADTYRGRANVLFIDVREDSEAAKRFGIQMIPTQIYFDGRGTEIKRVIGFADTPDLINGLMAAGLK
jgi:thioredoxin 1